PGAVNVEGSKAAGFHGRGGIGRMRLYDAHLVKLDLSKLTQVTFPGVIYRTKTKRHAPQVATFSQGQQITASLRIGYSEREIKPIVVFPQFQRVRLSAPQQHGGSWSRRQRMSRPDASDCRNAPGRITSRKSAIRASVLNRAAYPTRRRLATVREVAAGRSSVVMVRSPRRQ